MAKTKRKGGRVDGQLAGQQHLGDGKGEWKPKEKFLVQRVQKWVGKEVENDPDDKAASNSGKTTTSRTISSRDPHAALKAGEKLIREECGDDMAAPIEGVEVTAVSWNYSRKKVKKNADADAPDVAGESDGDGDKEGAEGEGSGSEEGATEGAEGDGKDGAG